VILTCSFILRQDALVSLKVYNTLGQEVATLANKELFTEGVNEVTFEAHNLPSGVYFYRIVAEGLDEEAPTNFTQVKKMLLLK